MARCDFELGTKSEGFWRCPAEAVVIVETGIASIDPVNLCAAHAHEMN